MTDVTQGADAPDDTALFNEAVASETLTEFENPKPVEPEPPKPAPAPVADGPKPIEPKPDDNAPVPPGRLREEAELRRRAERERDELRAQLHAVQRPQPPPPQAPPKPDIFENPGGFVREEMKPLLEQVRAEYQARTEQMSLDWAISRHGDDTVMSARKALEQGMARNDSAAWSTYNRAMQSHDPYGVIVKAHQDSETLRSIGGDINSYRQRILEEAMSDPEYRAKVIAAAKSQNGATHVARPATSTVASSPSLGNVGAGGGDQQIHEPSDEELFRAATTARRR